MLPFTTTAVQAKFIMQVNFILINQQRTRIGWYNSLEKSIKYSCVPRHIYYDMSDVSVFWPIDSGDLLANRLSFDKKLHQLLLGSLYHLTLTPYAQILTVFLRGENRDVFKYIMPTFREEILRHIDYYRKSDRVLPLP